MSFTRSKYDSCETTKETVEARGPGNYMMNTPVYLRKLSYRLIRGVMAQKTVELVLNSGVGQRLDSIQALLMSNQSLRNINKPASRCPDRKYLPNTNGTTSNSGYPAGGKELSVGTKNAGMRHPWTRAPDGNLIDHAFMSFLNTEDCRLSNPPSGTLRGTGFGINRFNPLCLRSAKERAISR